MTEWTVQKDDMVGGYIVTNYPHPASQQLYRDLEGNVKGAGYIIADCTTEEDAQFRAVLHNL